jgi:hypothetical protein
MKLHHVVLLFSLTACGAEITGKTGVDAASAEVDALLGTEEAKAASDARAAQALETLKAQLRGNPCLEVVCNEGACRVVDLCAG